VTTPLAQAADHLRLVQERLRGVHVTAVSSWRDEAQVYFDKTYWSALDGQYGRTQRELDTLVQVCAAATERVR